ncbi:MAG: hypothetical protein Q7J73_04580 [Dehalococcoidales bacterium]|nr:hypothetical protein [Dehalococcoidales bacterium]
MSPRVKRKRGGQPGNQNSRTHGFYSRFLDPETSKDIQQVTMLNGVDEEVALLRHKILSVVANDPKNLEVFLRAFNAMARLTRTRQGLKQYDNRKMSKAVAYILRDTASLVGLYPAKPKGLPPASDSSPSPGHPEAGEAGSLPRDESGTALADLR